MVDTKNPGDKTLSVPSKTLSLKPRVEQGTVRQSFSHGRTKQVVVEKRGKRRMAAEAPAPEAAAPAAAAAPALRPVTPPGSSRACCRRPRSRSSADTGSRSASPHPCASSAGRPGGCARSCATGSRTGAGKAGCTSSCSARPAHLCAWPEHDTPRASAGPEHDPSGSASRSEHDPSRPAASLRVAATRRVRRTVPAARSRTAPDPASFFAP